MVIGFSNKGIKIILFLVINTPQHFIDVTQTDFTTIRNANLMNAHEIWIGLKTCCAVNWTKRPTDYKRNIFPLVPRPLPTNLDVCSPCAGPEIVVYKKLFHKLHNSTSHCVQTACFLLECNTNPEIFVTGILQLYSLHNFQILGKNSIIQYQYRPDLY